MSKYESAEYQNSVRDMVRREVGHCVSSLVADLAHGYANDALSGGLSDLCSQAFELCTSVPDYEEAAIQEGWTRDESADEFRLNDKGDGAEAVSSADDWQELCDEQNIEPYESEVYEHWIVSTWLANRLAECGERVDKDFAGLCVWGRTCTGQAILLDRVICEIYDAMMERVA